MTDDFIRGILVTLIAVSLLLASQYGNQFHFLHENGMTIILSFGTALNWKTVIIFSVVYYLFFTNLPKDLSLASKTWFALLLIAFSWACFDLLWMVKYTYMGAYLFGAKALTYPTTRELVIGVTRNLVIIGFSAIWVHSCFVMNRNVALGFLSLAGYWFFFLFPIFKEYILLISGSIYPGSMFYLPFYNPIYYVVNFIPFLLSFKEWRGMCWKTFLLS